jgi:hypothetical protein
VPLFDLKFLIEFAATVQELEIGGTGSIKRTKRQIVGVIVTASRLYNCRSRKTLQETPKDISCR